VVKPDGSVQQEEITSRGYKAHTAQNVPTGIVTTAHVTHGNAADNKAFLPDLAGSLNILGVRLSELGRRDEALQRYQEALKISRELEKLERNLGGIRNMERLPSAIFVLDTKKEDIAVTEANKLGLPIVATVDTNCDPDIIQFVIPGNDDAIRSANLMARVIADAVEEGRYIASRSRKGAAEAEVVVAERTPEEEAAHEAAQADARREAALAAQQREARIAAEKEAPSAEAEPATEATDEAVTETVPEAEAVDPSAPETPQES
jgi:small subunit ribosomal protein S2